MKSTSNTQFDILVHKYIHQYMNKVSSNKDPLHFRTKLWCEFCGSQLPSWDVVMVERSEKALPLALASEIKEQMACKTCITIKGLKKSQSESAINFKASNYAIKEIMNSNK